jgi:hypothetical protein
MSSRLIGGDMTRNPNGASARPSRRPMIGGEAHAPHRAESQAGYGFPGAFSFRPRTAAWGLDLRPDPVTPRRRRSSLGAAWAMSVSAVRAAGPPVEEST